MTESQENHRERMTQYDVAHAGELMIGPCDHNSGLSLVEMSHVTSASSSCSSPSTATVECNNACGRLPLHRDDSISVSFVLELAVQQSGAITVREQGISKTCFSKSPQVFLHFIFDWLLSTLAIRFKFAMLSASIFNS